MPKPLTAEEREILQWFLRWRGFSDAAAIAKINQFEQELGMDTIDPGRQQEGL
jgi:hypothetical protein